MLCALFWLLWWVLNRLPRAFFQDGLIVEGPGIDLGGNGVIDIVLVGNDSNLLIVFYVQIMPDDFVMQLHRF